MAYKGLTPLEDLEIWPDTLHFIEPWVNGDQEQLVRLHNTTSYHVVTYRVMITSSDMYIVTPRQGFIRHGEMQFLSIKLKFTDKVFCLDNQGFQLESLYWKGTYFDDDEKDQALQLFRSGDPPHRVQKVRMLFPTDVTKKVPANHFDASKKVPGQEDHSEQKTSSGSPKRRSRRSKRGSKRRSKRGSKRGSKRSSKRGQR